MEDLGIDIFDARDLRERLTGGVRTSEREVVFLVGSALSAPLVEGGPGVPGVWGVVELIEREFDEEQRAELRAECDAAANRYQAAFQFLLRRHAQQEVNGVIRKAVARARLLPTDGPATPYEIGATTPEDVCRSFDADLAGWHLAPGVEALGRLAAGWPDRFVRTVLTTNFDPLVSVAVARAGGPTFRTMLHRDGDIGQAASRGPSAILGPESEPVRSGSSSGEGVGSGASASRNKRVRRAGWRPGALTKSEFRIAYVTGIGGQGKSSLAGAFFRSPNRLFGIPTLVAHARLSDERMTAFGHIETAAERPDSGLSTLNCSCI